MAGSKDSGKSGQPISAALTEEHKFEQDVPRAGVRLKYAVKNVLRSDPPLIPLGNARNAGWTATAAPSINLENIRD